MKCIALALTALMMLACGGSGGSGPTEPATPPNPPFAVANGSFNVVASLTVDGCARKDVWDGPYDLQLDGATFTMGTWTGTWNSKAHQARGETEHAKHTVRNCTVSEWTSVYITFTNKDSFYGSVIFRHSIAGDCPNLKACSTSWTITGKRATPP